MPDYCSDLRKFIEVLDHRGLLYRWLRPINKDTELMPLMRVQYRGRADAERQAFRFENVTDGQDLLRNLRDGASGIPQDRA